MEYEPYHCSVCNKWMNRWNKGKHERSKRHQRMAVAARR